MNRVLIITAAVFLLVYIFLKIKDPTIKSSKNLTLDDKYNSEKMLKQNQLDEILDEINKKGLEKLTEKEKEKLKELSK